MISSNINKYYSNKHHSKKSHYYSLSNEITQKIEKNKFAPHKNLLKLSESNEVIKSIRNLSSAKSSRSKIRSKFTHINLNDNFKKLDIIEAKIKHLKRINSEIDMLLNKNEIDLNYYNKYENKINDNNQIKEEEKINKIKEQTITINNFNNINNNNILIESNNDELNKFISLIIKNNKSFLNNYNIEETLNKLNYNNNNNNNNDNFNNKKISHSKSEKQFIEHKLPFITEYYKSNDKNIKEKKKKILFKGSNLYQYINNNNDYNIYNNNYNNLIKLKNKNKSANNLLEKNFKSNFINHHKNYKINNIINNSQRNKLHISEEDQSNIKEIKKGIENVQSMANKLEKHFVSKKLKINNLNLNLYKEKKNNKSFLKIKVNNNCVKTTLNNNNNNNNESFLKGKILFKKRLEKSNFKNFINNHKENIKKLTRFNSGIILPSIEKSESYLITKNNKSDLRGHKKVNSNYSKKNIFLEDNSKILTTNRNQNKKNNNKCNSCRFNLKNIKKNSINPIRIKSNLLDKIRSNYMNKK